MSKYLTFDGCLMADLTTSKIALMAGSVKFDGSFPIPLLNGINRRDEGKLNKLLGIQGLTCYYAARIRDWMCGSSSIIPAAKSSTGVQSPRFFHISFQTCSSIELATG